MLMVAKDIEDQIVCERYLYDPQEALASTKKKYKNSMLIFQKNFHKIDNDIALS